MSGIGGMINFVFLIVFLRCVNAENEEFTFFYQNITNVYQQIAEILLFIKILSINNDKFKVRQILCSKHSI